MAEKIIRKPDPSQRKTIHMATFKKIHDFLKEQESPIFLRTIVKQLSVDYNSLKLALETLPIQTDEDGRISLKRKEK